MYVGCEGISKNGIMNGAFLKNSAIVQGEWYFECYAFLKIMAPWF